MKEKLEEIFKRIPNYENFIDFLFNYKNHDFVLDCTYEKDKIGFSYRLVIDDGLFVIAFYGKRITIENLKELLDFLLLKNYVAAGVA